MGTFSGAHEIILGQYQRTAHRMTSRGKRRPEKMPIIVIIPRRPSPSPHFATAAVADTLTRSIARRRKDPAGHPVGGAWHRHPRRSAMPGRSCGDTGQVLGTVGNHRHRTAPTMLSRGTCRPEEIPMTVVISHLSSLSSSCATAPVTRTHVTLRRKGAAFLIFKR